MYSDVDYCRYKTVLSQFKNLTRLFILSTSIISSFAFAGAAEDRNRDVLQAANDSKYSSATGKNYTVGGVSSNNGTVSARVDQRVVVGGSSAEVKTKVSFPADFKDVARTAGKLARTAGGLYLADKAFQGLMDGVDYVLDPKNNTIQKPNPEYKLPTKVENWHQYRFYISRTQEYVASIDALQKITNANYVDSTWTNCVLRYESTVYLVYCDVKNKNTGGTSNSIAGYRQANPYYNPTSVNPNQSHIPSNPAEMEDAFYKWMINNPTSVTDPVTTYIYSPNQHKLDKLNLHLLIHLLARMKSQMK